MISIELCMWFLGEFGQMFKFSSYKDAKNSPPHSSDWHLYNFLSFGCFVYVCVYLKFNWVDFLLYVGAATDICWLLILHLMAMRSTQWCTKLFRYSDMTLSSKPTLLSLSVYPVHIVITTDPLKFRPLVFLELNYILQVYYCRLNKGFSLKFPEG